MAFSIREVTIHLAGGQAPCLPASPNEQPNCPGGTCRPTRNNPRPGDDGKPRPGAPKRSLALLQARLREALAPPL
ncbi:MAG: hypothetical protein ACJ759_21070 [Thermoanaerobaculia bacterium]